MRLALLGLLMALPAWGQNLVRGERLYRARCSSCHALEENGPGPRHRGLFGRQVGTQPGFDYSPALAIAGFTWNARTLDRWLRNPNTMVPGNAMKVRLANKEADRVDLIAWLMASTGAPDSVIAR